MAITVTLVGTGSKNNNASGTSVDVTLNQAVAAGKVLVLAVFATSVVTATAISDDQSNSWTGLTGVNNGQGTGYWAHAPVTNALASGEKITVTFSGVAARRFVVALMIDGADASYIDAQGSGQGGTGTSPSISTGPQAQAGEMMLTWLYVTSPLVSITEASGWTTETDLVVENRTFHLAAKEMATTSSSTYAPTISSSQGWNANWLALKQATASGYTLSAAAGALTLGGQAAGAKATRKLPIAARSFTLAGINAAVRKGYRVRADVRGYGLTGRAAGVARSLQLAVSVGVYGLTGLAAGLNRTVAGRTLTAASASFAANGQGAGLKAARKLPAASEAYVWSRLNALLRQARRMVAAAGGYGLSGRQVGWGWTHILTPVPAAFGLGAAGATFRYSGGQGWQPVPGVAETWAPQPGVAETWTPLADTSEIWS